MAFKSFISVPPSGNGATTLVSVTLANGGVSASGLTEPTASGFESALLRLFQRAAALTDPAKLKVLEAAMDLVRVTDANDIPTTVERVTVGSVVSLTAADGFVRRNAYLTLLIPDLAVDSLGVVYGDTYYTAAYPANLTNLSNVVGGPLDTSRGGTGMTAPTTAGQVAVTQVGGAYALQPYLGSVQGDALTGVVATTAGDTVTLRLSDTLTGTAFYGSPTTVAQITVNAQGRITSGASVPIQLPASQVTGLSAEVASAASALGFEPLPQALGTGSSPTFAGLTVRSPSATTTGSMMIGSATLDFDGTRFNIDKPFDTQLSINAPAGASTAGAVISLTAGAKTPFKIQARESDGLLHFLLGGTTVAQIGGVYGFLSSTPTNVRSGRFTFGFGTGILDFATLTDNRFTFGTPGLPGSWLFSGAYPVTQKTQIANFASTGLSTTVNSGVTDLVLNPLNPYAAHTVKLPSNALDGTTITVMATKRITALTFTSDDPDAVINGSPVMLAANGGTATMFFSASDDTWYSKSAPGALAAFTDWSNIVPGTQVKFDVSTVSGSYPITFKNTTAYTNSDAYGSGGVLIQSTGLNHNQPLLVAQKSVNNAFYGNSANLVLHNDGGGSTNYTDTSELPVDLEFVGNNGLVNAWNGKWEIGTNSGTNVAGHSRDGYFYIASRQGDKSGSPNTGFERYVNFYSMNQGGVIESYGNGITFAPKYDFGSASPATISVTNSFQGVSLSLGSTATGGTVTTSLTTTSGDITQTVTSTGGNNTLTLTANGSKYVRLEMVGTVSSYDRLRTSTSSHAYRYVESAGADAVLEARGSWSATAATSGNAILNLYTKSPTQSPVASWRIMTNGTNGRLNIRMLPDVTASAFKETLDFLPASDGMAAFYRHTDSTQGRIQLGSGGAIIGYDGTRLTLDKSLTDGLTIESVASEAAVPGVTLKVTGKAAWKMENRESDGLLHFITGGATAVVFGGATGVESAVTTTTGRFTFGFGTAEIDYGTRTASRFTLRTNGVANSWLETGAFLASQKTQASSFIGSAQTTTVLRGVTDVVLDPSTVVTAHTVVLPTAPPDGVAVSVTSTRNIATLTFTSLDATAVINGATTALQGNQGSVDLLYVASTNSWQPKATANLVTATLNGLAPASGGGTTNFLRADGTWAAPPSPPTPTTVTSTQAGLAPASGGGTTNFLRADSTWAAPPYPSAVTSTDAGLAPASGGGTTNFLRADGTWAAPTTTYTPTSHFLQATYTQTTPISVPATNLASWTQVKASNASVKGDANELLDVAATGSYLVSITGRMRVGAVTGPAVYYVQFSVYSLSGNLLSTFYAGPQSGAFTAAASYVIAHTFIADIGHNDPMLINAVLSTSGATVTPAWTTAGTGTETRMGSPLTVTFTKI